MTDEGEIADWLQRFDSVVVAHCTLASQEARATRAYVETAVLSRVEAERIARVEAQRAALAFLSPARVVGALLLAGAWGGVLGFGIARVLMTS